MTEINDEAAKLAFRLHRNFLRRNQNAPQKGDWRDFYPVARAFLGLD
jgi:hypothetical protein